MKPVYSKPLLKKGLQFVMTADDFVGDFLKLDGSNANTTIDIQGEDLTTTGDITAGNLAISNWNTAYTHSQLVTGNPHDVDQSDVGLSNVDNTSDANKPVSTATQTALDLKVDENVDITPGTKTKITYDAKGLVTAGADATTADIADSTNKRYVTDAESTVIDNTSNTNTGDQDLSTLALKSNVLELDNTDAFTPDADYEPATKKYVDDNAGASPLTTKGDLFGYSTVDARIPIGTDGFVLTADSAQGLGLKWSAVAETGDVVGPASAVDDRIATFNGITGKLIQDGGSKIADVLARANHTGTQAASTISDFDTEVGNNSAVSLNTAKDTNVTTNLSLGAVNATTMVVASSDGTNATLIAADTDDAGLMTATQFDKLAGIETAADVTDTANVTSAGALMDSEVDADIKTLALPANTTITTFGASLIDDADAGTARGTLDVDQSGTDNSTDVTLAGTPDYLTLSGQEITLNDINLTTDVTGLLPSTNIADEYVKNAGDTMTGDLGLGGVTPTATVHIGGTQAGGNRLFLADGTIETSANFQAVRIDPILEPGATALHLYGSLNNATVDNSSNSINSLYGCQYKTVLGASYSGTVTNSYGLNVIDSAISGAGTLTNNFGISVADMTAGTNNYGIRTLVSSGSNKFNIYASGTAGNYFAGDVGIGTNTPTTLLNIDETRTEDTARTLFSANQVWSPTTTTGSVFPTVFALTPSYGSTHSPASGFLTGFRSFASLNSSGVINVINLDLLSSNKGSGTVSYTRDIWLRSAANSGGGTINTHYSIFISPQTAATTNYNIYSSGTGKNFFDNNVSIGTTANNSRLTVADDITPSVDNTYDIGSASFRWDDIRATNGTIVTSDLNDKDQIEDSVLGLDFINALRPVRYKWKDYTSSEIREEIIGQNQTPLEDGSGGVDNTDIIESVLVETEYTHKRKHYGMIAQEVEQTLVDLGVSNTDFAGLIIDENGKYGLRYNEFISPMVKAIQELYIIIETQQARLNVLESL